MNLFSPKWIKTRPTSDRNKEALFAIIGARIDGASFLDMYCGSGATGIEALSRGAAFALFNDASRDSLDLVRKNLDKTRLDHLSRINHGRAENAVKLLGHHGSVFDIIFLDPPYDSAELAMIIPLIRKNGILAERGLIIAETEAGQTLPGFEGYKSETRKYGNTKFVFMEDSSIEDSDISGQF
jgi:16S rRNA (guanine(966)-N(2))-methyltransferase RsmD